jgi:putative DNA primase/helicase
MTAVGRVIAALDEHGFNPRPNGRGGVSSRCPGHPDQHPSLDLDQGEQGAVLQCRSQHCDPEVILGRIGLTLADLFDDRPQRNGDGARPKLVRSYPYPDENYVVLYTVERWEPGFDGRLKSFRQVPASGDTGKGAMAGVRRVLYRLPQVLDAVRRGDVVYVVEGEKDAEAMAAAGFCATCNVGGAGKWRDDYSEVLAGSQVVVVADKDRAGYKHASDVADSLIAHGCDVRVVEAAVGKDASDHLGAGLSVSEFVPVRAEQLRVSPESDGAHPSDEPIHRSGFLGRDGLDVTALVAHVLGAGPVTMGVDDRLWSFRYGVWLPDGEAEVGRRVRDALGQRYRVMHLNTVLSWLRQDVPTIAAQPTMAWINCRDGLLHWQSGRLETHRPDICSTVQLPVAWRPDATCPAIDAFFAEVLPADVADGFIDEVLGFLVICGLPMHHAFLLLGGGFNGKGAFLRLITALLGEQNIATVSLHALADNRFAPAQLVGKTANICGDLPNNLIEHTDIFKAATGGDTITGEHKYGRSFTFRSFATMIFAANEAPPARDRSDGYYQRWIVIPFPNRFVGADATPDHILDERLQTTAELEGVLVRAVRGLGRLMARGHFDPPPSVIDAAGQFRRDTDIVAAFAAERLVVRGDCWLPRTDVWTNFGSWCEDNNVRRITRASFYEALRNLPTKVSTRRGVRGFLAGWSDAT